MAGSTFTVERERHIDAPPEAIRERIVDFHQWRSWSPWEDLDPNLRRSYDGPHDGVGAVYEWTGNRKAGAGRMEILHVDEGRVDVDLRFDRPFKSRNSLAFTFEPQTGGTLVTWRMTGPQTLVSRVMGLFTSMDKMIGPDFERGLDRLKADAEAAAG